MRVVSFDVIAAGAVRLLERANTQDEFLGVVIIADHVATIVEALCDLRGDLFHGRCLVRQSFSIRFEAK